MTLPSYEVTRRSACRRLNRTRGWAFALCCMLAGCTDPGPLDTPESMPTETTRCGDAIICEGDVATTCSATGIPVSIDCSEAGLRCIGGRGCLACAPSLRTCDGDTPLVCRDDGSGWDAEPACDGSARLHCQRETGTCIDLCEVAAQNASYIGCEYWPTVTINPTLSEEFEFAIAVSNPQSVPARITVDRAGDAADVVAGPTVIAPDAVAVIPLPWHDDLRLPDRSTPGRLSSLLARRSAYRLASDVPVTVYQFNPLHYRIDRDCVHEPDGMSADGECFSFSNDASLLLPSHVLTGNYLVTARASQWMTTTLKEPDGSLGRDVDGRPLPAQGLPVPGFLSVVAVDQSVSVEVRFSARTEAGTSRELRSYERGDSHRFALQRGDVLQILSASPAAPPGCASTQETTVTEDGQRVEYQYCKPELGLDLTGTRIAADGRVSVLAGHACAFVPFDRWACDHLEESMFPMETWGRKFAVAMTRPFASEPNVVRLLAAEDSTLVRFEPGVHPEVTLDAGEFIEFEAFEDFVAESSGPLTVGQFLAGGDYAGLRTGDEDGAGDPAFSLATPADQYRSRYDFLAPDSYPDNWISVVANVGERVELDGLAIDGWQRIGNTDKQATRVFIEPGSHRMQSGGRFGVTVYGFGRYTSYMYPAGLDFQRIVEIL